MRNGVSHRTKGIYDTQIGRFFMWQEYNPYASANAYSEE